MKSVREPKLWEALVPIIGMMLIIVIGILKFGLEPHIPIVLACILAAFMAKKSRA